MLNKLNVAISGALMLAACQPIEYAEELTNNRVNLHFHTDVKNNPKLTVHLETEPEPVLEQHLTSDSLEDFRGPPGWYFGIVSGDINSDSENEELIAVFEYKQSEITNVTFGSLGTFAYALTQCSGKQTSVSESSAIIMQSIGIDPSQQIDVDTPELTNAFEGGVSDFALSLGASYSSFLTLAKKDIESDCLLNGYLVDRSTGARETIDYFGSVQTAASLSTNIAKHISEWSISNNLDAQAIVEKLTNTSSTLFDDRVDRFDTEAPSITPVTDLEVSVFGQIQIEFRYSDNVGVESITASVSDSPLTVQINPASKSFSVSGDVSALPSEITELDIVIQDIANNVSEVQYELIVDNLGPSVSILSNHYPQSSNNVILEVTPPTGAVSFVSVDGNDFTFVGDNEWTGPLNLNISSNSLTIDIETNFGLSVTRNITAYMDVDAPTITFTSNQVNTSDANGLNPGSKNVHALNSSDYVDYTQNEMFLLGNNRIANDLNATGIPYLSLTVDDLTNDESTPKEKIVITKSLTIDGVDIYSDEAIGTGDSLFSLTIEDLGLDFTSTETGSLIELSLIATDLAGNSSAYPFVFNSHSSQATRSLDFVNLSGEIEVLLWKSGSSSSLVSIQENNFNNSEFSTDDQYTNFYFNTSNTNYSDDMGNLYNNHEGGLTEVVTTPTSNINLPVGLGMSIYGAFTSAGFYQGDTPDLSFANGDISFKSALPGVLFNYDNLPLASISSYGLSEAASIFNEAIILAASEAELLTGNVCTAFDLDYAAAQDFKDDLIANNSTNPVQSYCKGISPFKAIRLIAKHEREILNHLGLLTEGNDFDVNITRNYYNSQAPTLIKALPVGTYSGSISFTPEYLSDTDTYTVEVFRNDVLVGSYAPGEEILIDTTVHPNGIYVIRLEATDLYFNTNITSLFSTFQN